MSIASAANFAARMRRAASSASLIACGRPGRAVAADIGAAVGHQHDERRLALAAARVGQPQGGIEAGGDRRAAAAGKSRQRLARPRCRAGRRQHDFAGLAAKGDQRDMVAPHIAIGKQQFDRALDLGEPVHRERAGGVNHENRRRAAPLAIAHDTKILGSDDHQALGALRALRLAQAPPGRRRAQRRDQREPAFGERSRRAHPAAGRARANKFPRLICRRRAMRRSRRKARGEARQQARRNGRARRLQHLLLQFARATCLRPSCASGSGSRASGSGGWLGLRRHSRVARGPSTSAAASSTSSSSVVRAPRNAASARAARSANNGARSEATPSSAAMATSVAIAASVRFDLGQKPARRREISSGANSGGSMSRRPMASRSTQKASRSASAAGVASSSMPSSSATSPNRAGHSPRQTVALQRDFAAIERRAEPRGDRTRHAARPSRRR